MFGEPAPIRQPGVWNSGAVRFVLAPRGDPHPNTDGALATCKEYDRLWASLRTARGRARRKGSYQVTSRFRLLFVGDVVGPGGCSAVRALAPHLREELDLDVIIANGENSAPSGMGITDESGETLLSVVDYLTLGDHAFDQEGAGDYLDRETRVVRPANLDEETRGRGWGVLEAGGVRVGITSVQGRVFMRRVSAPFEAADRAVGQLEASGADLILLDIHAEATSEKQALGWHLAGRVAAVVGTHTHVPTADSRVLRGETAYVTDVGMTGGSDGIIGLDRDRFMRVFLDGEDISSVGPARPPIRLDAVLVEADPDSGRATLIERIVRTWDG